MYIGRPQLRMHNRTVIDFGYRNFELQKMHSFKRSVRLQQKEENGKTVEKVEGEEKTDTKQRSASQLVPNGTGYAPSATLDYRIQFES